MTQWEMKRTKDIFCPKCKGTNIDDCGAETPEWISNRELAVSAEYMTCKDCGHKFAVGTSYNLSGFCFLGDDEDDTDYCIGD